MDILILGCGVSGLTCGLLLAREGHNVKIKARDFPPHTTSNKAGAVWFPYRAHPREKVHQWSKASYGLFEDLAREENTGVSMTELLEVYEREIGDPWWEEAVPHQRFRRARLEELPSDYQWGFVVEVPLIDPAIYMKYLFDEFQAQGGVFSQGEVENLGDLPSHYSLIVNCTGLGAGPLLDDEKVYPIQGHMIYLDREAQRPIFDDTSDRAPAYIIPRQRGCVIGGTAEEGDSSTEIRTDRIVEILLKTFRLDPKISGSHFRDAWVGLRPGRTEVRLEREELDDQRVIIHNYGHGGSGFTLSWGCAGEVKKLVDREIGSRE